MCNCFEKKWKCRQNFTFASLSNTINSEHWVLYLLPPGNLFAESPEICVACQIFILIMAWVQHNVSRLNLPLSHIFWESTFDGWILNVFNFGMKFVDYSFGHYINYILNKFSFELQIVFFSIIIGCFFGNIKLMTNLNHMKIPKTCFPYHVTSSISSSRVSSP